MRLHDRLVFIETFASPSFQVAWPVHGSPFCLVILADNEIPPHNLSEFNQFAESAVGNGARLVIIRGTAANQIEDLFDELVAVQAIAASPLLRAEDTVLTVALQKVPLYRLVREVFEVYELPVQYQNQKESPVVFLLLKQDGETGPTVQLSDELRRYAARDNL